MARPIRNTPTLYGEDAERFLAEIAILPSPEERKREREKIQESINDFLRLITEKRKSGSI